MISLYCSQADNYLNPCITSRMTVTSSLYCVYRFELFNTHSAQVYWLVIHQGLYVPNRHVYHTHNIIWLVIKKTNLLIKSLEIVLQ